MRTFTVTLQLKTINFQREEDEYLIDSLSNIANKVKGTLAIYVFMYLYIYVSMYLYIYVSHIDSVCFKTVSSIFKTGSTLKCCYALSLDFTALTHLYFSVALYMYI